MGGGALLERLEGVQNSSSTALKGAGAGPELLNRVAHKTGPPLDALRSGTLEKRVTRQDKGRSLWVWAPRFVELTKEALQFSLEQGGPVREHIELIHVTVLSFDRNGDETSGQSNGALNKLKSRTPSEKSPNRSTQNLQTGAASFQSLMQATDGPSGCIRIFVERSNRNYYIRAKSVADTQEWMDALEDAQRIAHTRYLAMQHATITSRIRFHMSKVHNSKAFQILVAVALCSNFALNIVETELQPDKDDELFRKFELVDLCFTAFYVTELAINLFVHWLTPFLRNGWSMFDAICVISGLVAEIMQAIGNGDTNLTMIRTLRIFKIIRLFSRLKSLQTIVMAITATIMPLFNTFLIYGVVLSIYSVLGVQLFGSLYPERFGLFSSAVLTMFQISTGDGWLTDVLRPLMKIQEEEELHIQNVGSILFFISFILFVMIVLVNVAVAVLLEGFLSSISRYVQEERQAVGMTEYLKSAGDLDSLLATISNYDSEENLESMIHHTYQYLDVDASDSVDFAEFRDGLEKLEIEPRIYVTWETFERFTRNQTLCDSYGCLTSASFALCMRIQLRGYAQRIVAHQMKESIKHSKDNAAEYFAQKILMTEIFSMSQKLCPLTLEELGQNESTASRLEKVQMVPQAQGNEYSGWIYKKGRVNTAFQKRFLVLKDGLLSYYLARPLMENEKPQGSILTEICDCVEDLGTHPNFGFQFSIKANTRDYVFAAPTSKERTRWIMAIQSAKLMPGAMIPDEDPKSSGEGILPSVPEVVEPRSLDLGLSPGSVTLDLRKRALRNGSRHGSPASASEHEDSSTAVPAIGNSEGALLKTVGPTAWSEEACGLDFSEDGSEAKTLLQIIREKRKAEEALLLMVERYEAAVAGLNREKSALVRKNANLRKQLAEMGQENRRAVADNRQLVREQVSNFFMGQLLAQNNRLMIGQGSAPSSPGGPFQITHRGTTLERMGGSSQEEGARRVSGSGQKEGVRSDQ